MNEDGEIIDTNTIQRKQSKKSTTTTTMVSDKQENKKNAQHQDNLSNGSFVSTLPDSFYSSSREDILDEMNKVDMTLDSQLNSFDVKAYLVDLLTDCIYFNSIIFVTHIIKEMNVSLNSSPTSRRSRTFS